MKFQISEYTVKEFEELTPYDITNAISHLKVKPASQDPNYSMLKERQKMLRSKKRQQIMKALPGIQKKAIHLKDLDNKRKFKEGPKRNKKWWKKLKDKDKEYYKNHFLEIDKKKKMKDKKKILKGPIHKPRL